MPKSFESKVSSWLGILFKCYVSTNIQTLKNVNSKYIFYCCNKKKTIKQDGNKAINKCIWGD